MKRLMLATSLFAAVLLMGSSVRADDSQDHPGLGRRLERTQPGQCRLPVRHERDLSRRTIQRKECRHRTNSRLCRVFH